MFSDTAVFFNNTVLILFAVNGFKRQVSKVKIVLSFRTASLELCRDGCCAVIVCDNARRPLTLVDDQTAVICPLILCPLIPYLDFTLQSESQPTDKVVFIEIQLIVLTFQIFIFFNGSSIIFVVKFSAKDLIQTQIKVFELVIKRKLRSAADDLAFLIFFVLIDRGNGLVLRFLIFTVEGVHINFVHNVCIRHTALGIDRKSFNNDLLCAIHNLDQHFDRVIDRAMILIYISRLCEAENCQVAEFRNRCRRVLFTINRPEQI